MVQFYLLDEDINPGTAIEVQTRDLPRVGVTKAIIGDVTAQESAATAATRANVAKQIDQVRIGAEESSRISEIDGEDLDAMNVLMGNNVLFDAEATDNARIVWGFTYGLDPFMWNPDIDYNQPFGISGNVARKISVAFDADGNNIDDKRIAIGIIVANTPTEGYVTFHRDEYTEASGTYHKTDVPQPGKLIGVLNFETNGAADVTTDGNHRTGQSIRQQSITIGEKDVLGPIYTTTMAALNGAYEIGALIDEGYSLWNLGMTNKVGVPSVQTKSRIPSNMKIKSLCGDNATKRTYAITLNDNV